MARKYHHVLETKTLETKTMENPPTAFEYVMSGFKFSEYLQCVKENNSFFADKKFGVEWNENNVYYESVYDTCEYILNNLKSVKEIYCNGEDAIFIETTEKMPPGLMPVEIATAVASLTPDEFDMLDNGMIRLWWD